MIEDSKETLWTCCWSSNGKILAASGADKIIRLYQEGRLTDELRGAHSKSVRSLSFCPRRAKIAAASFDGTISIWSKFTGDCNSGADKWRCSATLEGHENEVKSVGWSVFMSEEDEEEQVFLATCGRDKTVWIWAMEEEDEDFECLAVLQEHEQDVKCLTWHPERPLFLTASYDGSVLAWGTINSSLDDWILVGRVVKGLDATIWSLAFSPDASRLALALSDGSIILYSFPKEWKSFDEATKNIIQICKPIPISEIDKSDRCNNNMKSDCNNHNDDDSDCCNDDDKSNSNSCCKSNQNDRNSSSSASDEEEEEGGGCCGGGGSSNKRSKTKSSCCSSTAKSSRPLEFPPAEIYSLAWSCDSSLLALACSDHAIRIYSTADGAVETIQNAHEGEVNGLAWSPVDKSILASVGDDSALKLWKIEI